MSLKAIARSRAPLSGAALASSVAATGAALLLPSAAAACGGFFCNQSAPVEQTGEHIIFAVDEVAGTTEATVLVNYAGPSEEFAWIVPTPSFPEIGVSSATVFARIESLIGPRFQLTWSTRGTCDYGWVRSDESGGGFADAAAAGDSGADAGAEVVVVAQQSVGPYDTVILQATDAELLLDWLQENDYDVPDVVLPYVQPYVIMGSDIHFVAFKLQSDRSVGDLQPIVLRYDGMKPAIPIQLTAVATQPDLGVTATVLGPHRAVPENYLSVEINMARLDWLSGGSNYDALIVDAMDEAGGQGFRTEFAGPTSPFDGWFFREGQFNRGAIEAATPETLINTLQAQGFFGDTQILRLLEQYFPPPEGVDARSFYNCVACYEVGPGALDALGLAEALWAAVVEPLEHAQEMFDALPYVTRLYTALSAEEMTLDPIFAFNPDLGDQPNVRTAEAIVDCGEGGDYYTSPLTIRLDDGRELMMERTGGDRSALDAMPAAQSIAETGASGPPVLVRDNAETIDVALAAHNALVADVVAGERSVRGGGGCASAAPAAPTGIAAAVLGACALVVRRRRRDVGA